MRSRERVTSPLTKVEKVWGLAKFSALTTTFCGVALHLMGSAYHRTYLKNWGIDNGLFEKTTDWLLVSAHYVLVDRTALLLNLLAKHMVALFGITAMIALGLWVARHFKFFCVIRYPEKQPRNTCLARQLARQSDQGLHGLRHVADCRAGSFLCLNLSAVTGRVGWQIHCGKAHAVTRRRLPSPALIDAMRDLAA